MSFSFLRQLTTWLLLTAGAPAVQQSITAANMQQRLADETDRLMDATDLYPALQLYLHAKMHCFYVCF